MRPLTHELENVEKKEESNITDEQAQKEPCKDVSKKIAEYFEQDAVKCSANKMLNNGDLVVHITVFINAESEAACNKQPTGEAEDFNKKDHGNPATGKVRKNNTKKKNTHTYDQLYSHTEDVRNGFMDHQEFAGIFGSNNCAADLSQIFLDKTKGKKQDDNLLNFNFDFEDQSTEKAAKTDSEKRVELGYVAWLKNDVVESVKKKYEDAITFDLL